MSTSQVPSQCDHYSPRNRTRPSDSQAATSFGRGRQRRLRSLRTSPLGPSTRICLFLSLLLLRKAERLAIDIESIKKDYRMQGERAELLHAAGTPISHEA